MIDGEVRAAVRGLVEVAPLHNAPAIRGIDEATETLGAVPQVAVFDTAFHASIPAEAATYAVPRRWREEWGIRRYGFHGLSVEWAAERVPASRLVVCHLGGGCSVTAVRDGRSVDTTMGFSPLEGVPMATRSGSVDPGALLHLLHTGALDSDGLDHALNHESGLAGLAGTTHVRELGARAARGDEDAALALGVFSYRVAQSVAAMAVAAGGLDALVFTAGIGEGSALVRQLVCSRLTFLGVELDRRLNDSAEPDADVSVAGKPRARRRDPRAGGHRRRACGAQRPQPRRLRAIPVRISRTIRSAASAVMSAEPTAVGITSTTSAPTISSSAASVRAAQRRSAVVIPPGSGVPVPGANAGSRTSTSIVRKTAPGADDLDRALHHLGDPQLAHVVHEEARDAVLGLPGELGLAGPVAAQADLDIPARVDVALLDEPVEGRPVGDLDAVHLGAGVGVGVEVDEPDRAVGGRDRADVRLRDRMVASEDDRDRAGRQHLPDDRLDGRVRADGIGRDHRRVAEVDDGELGEGIDLGLQMRPLRAARGADRARAETRSRSVGDEIVGRGADDCDVDSSELGGILSVGNRREREEPGVVRLFLVPARPALDGVDHGA